MAGRFLLVASDFRKTGGMDRANYALAEYLAERGSEVHLVGHSAGEGLRARANVHWHPVMRPLGHDALGWGLLARVGRHWAQRIGGGGGRVLVNGGNCAWGDVNWVHYVHAAYRPSIASEGVADRLWHNYKQARAVRDEGRALRRARVVIANSEHTRRELLARLGLAPERVHTVYYGCDARRFHPHTAAERQAARRQRGWDPEGHTALFVGALGDRRKGFDTLFSAWQRLCARPGWDVELAVAGQGGEWAAWQRRAAEAGMGVRCRFLGFCRDIPELLAACDLLIAPTRYEAYGLGVQEALASGLPALVSAEAGVAERIPPALSDWLLRNPESDTELEQKLLTWRASGGGWREPLAQLGLELRSHGWAAMAAQMLALAGAAAA